MSADLNRKNSSAGEERFDSDDLFDPENGFDFGSVTLTLEDDTDLECAVLSIFPAGEQQYIALLPLDENGDAAEDADILLYRFVDNGPENEPDLENIEDDEEYDIAADAFDEILDDMEFDDGTVEIPLDD